MVRVSPERLDPPRTLGHMTLLAKLGEGGMAGVYVASVGGGDLTRLAAVKLLRPGMPDHDYRQRFLDEAKLVVRLHHNNLIHVHEAGEIEEQLFIVMELVEGRDLADIWDRCAELGRAFPVPISVHIVRSALRGLHYAHTFPELELVHRDVSPSNILVDWAGAVRLADFGLATSSLKTSLTVPGVVFGKVGYMSPEQALRRPLDGRADVYGCGVVLWELLTGRPLRDAGFDTQAVVEFEARPPSLLSDRVDPELDAIVMRALANDRDARYRTANDFMGDLGQWASRHAPGTSQDTLAEFMQELFGNELEEDRAQYRMLREDMSGHKRTALLGSSSPAPSGHAIKQMAASQKQAPEQADGAQREEEIIRAGTVIAERYRVLGRLGQGGMGTVYMGEHVTVGRSVAIKVLTHQWSHNEAVAQRFRAEARAASAAGHPNIIEVFDAGTLDDGRLYLVMEFLTGSNLYEEVHRHGPFAVAKACRTMRDVARAVRAAHNVDIIHRDLKPENIMLADRGEEESVKVLDFGISAGASKAPGAGRLTVPGHALGTPQYMAPEQARGEEPTELFDVYAMGVLLYEVLTGVPPFDSDNVVDVLARKTMEPAPSVAERRKDLPTKLVQLVDDCMEISPERRPQSAQDFIDRIEEILRALPREAPTAPDARPANVRPSSSTVGVISPSASSSGLARPFPVAPVRRRRYTGIVGAGIAALALAAMAFGVWQMTSAPSRVEPPRIAKEEGRPSQPQPPPAAIEEPALEKQRDETSKTTPPEAKATEAAVPGDETEESAPTASEATEAWATPGCADIRRAAARARQRSAWNTLLRKVERGECWRKRSDHVHLRVQALAELERFEDCLNLGKGYNDPRIKRYVRLCAARTGK
jgi:serine/threonine-protein kinase